ncbi:MAG: hypothetical protein ABI873_19280 [Marmoricola sp.]
MPQDDVKTALAAARPRALGRRPRLVESPLTEKELAQALIDLASAAGTNQLTAQLMQFVADAGDEFHAIVGAVNVLRERFQLPPPHLLSALHSYDQTLTKHQRLLLEVPVAPAGSR